MSSTYKFPEARRVSPPSTSSVSDSIFDRRAPDPDDTTSLRTAVTEDDRSGSPAPSIASLNMARAGVSTRGKRKRLSKACDSCHKSKRRCDGTAPCANCDFAGKQCVYTDANGRVVPPPRNREETEDEHAQHNRPRRHSVSVAHLMTHSQHGHNVDAGGPAPSYATSPPSPTAIPSLPVLGHHHIRPEQPPRPFATPISPVPPSGWDYYAPYPPFYKRSPTDPGPAADRAPRRYDSFVPEPTADRGLYLGLKIASPRTSSGRLSGDKDAFDLDPHLARELVHLFFANQHPANLMLHRPTFIAALSRGQVPMPLLNSIFALAAPYSAQPALRTTPSWHAGERFAKASPYLCLPASFSHDLAAAQALCLLMLHECVMRRPTQNDQHMCESEPTQPTPARSNRLSLGFAFQIMKDLGVPAMDDPVAAAFPSEQSSYEHWISVECHRRTFWVLYVVESLSSAFTTRPMTFKDSQLKVRLPIDEASFELGIQKDSPPEYLQFPTTPQVSHTAELGHLVRVTWIYTTVMNQIMETNKKGRPSGPGDSVTADTIAYSEQRLHSWEASLPERLRFNSEMLHIQMVSLESGASLMELLPNRDAARAHSVRQQRALDNLTIILASLGQRGRLSMWTGTLLLALVRYRAAMSQHPDPHVSEWCAEFEKQWGISLGELINVEFRRSWCAAANGGAEAEKVADATAAIESLGPQPALRPRSPAPVYQAMVMPPSSVTLPPLQSFGLLHAGVAGPDGMPPPPPPAGLGQAQDRRVGMPRGMPWLEDELKNGQRER
ncbi:hypothetical protein FRC10_005923 [Ceratobasidium sp. 414]|nr:hypothetical protein FRC10_005923 [Ceratobasidium sp. 414]